MIGMLQEMIIQQHDAAFACWAASIRALANASNSFGLDGIRGLRGIEWKTT